MTATTVPGKVVQVALEPRDALGVEVVRGLVEEQHVRFLEQDATQRHATALAARELRHVGVGGRQTERVHRHLDLVVEVPQVVRVDLFLHARLTGEQLVHRRVLHRLGEHHRDVLEFLEKRALRLHRELDVAFDVERGIELWLLRQEPDACALARPGFALKIVIHAGHDAEQR